MSGSYWGTQLNDAVSEILDSPLAPLNPIPDSVFSTQLIRSMHLWVSTHGWLTGRRRAEMWWRCERRRRRH